MDTQPKQWVVYDKYYGIIGVHIGAKFLQMDDGVLCWPHVIVTSEGSETVLNDYNFRENYILLGEL